MSQSQNHTNLQRVQILELLALGQDSDLYRVAFVDDSPQQQHLVARKFRRRNTINSTLEVMFQLVRANKSYFVAILEDIPVIVAPYYGNGNIKCYLSRVPEPFRIQLITSVASELRKLHERDFVHGHIAPENILVDNDGQVVITNAQLEIVIRWEVSSGQETVPLPASWQYRPQEELREPQDADRKSPYSKAGDVFSFAAVAYEILVEPLPCSKRDAIRRLMHGAHMLSSVHRPDDHIWAILEPCFREDPTRRPSMIEVERSLRASLPCHE
ncbi:hypothetical protein JAAARDRAFT_69344 [Jaapia argillacea MUCL 33604]|uniref:Protein kinase domain-containing protein n=1 Tax=Jaapia argillacea MUCL 33604 TaxID=933084 RepID=A0A067PTH3_9AGAM|nr:hypothetical protein JAAARDRAFT_69344 [Jaapia argillacea MUCL 33604]